MVAGTKAAIVADHVANPVVDCAFPVNFSIQPPIGPNTISGKITIALTHFTQLNFSDLAILNLLPVIPFLFSIFYNV